eukprot:scaffold274316_cov21-Tisochrysis_lutea.AAC.2
MKSVLRACETWWGRDHKIWLEGLQGTVGCQNESSNCGWGLSGWQATEMGFGNYGRGPAG